METPSDEYDRADQQGMAYLSRLREAETRRQALAVIDEIEADPLIGDNQLTSLVAILGNGRYEARGPRDDLVEKLRRAVQSTMRP